MIFANINDYEKYECLHVNLDKAFQFLNRNDLRELSSGRYEICGDDLYAMVQEYETKPLEGAKYEAHKRYIDIQYMVDGREIMGYSSIYNLEVSEPYNSERDFEMLEGEKELLLLKNSEFFIFFPEDAHMPGIADRQSSKVRKVVVKIKA